MIEFSNGHSFEYMVASGGLDFDGNGYPWDQGLKFGIPGIMEPLLEPSLFTTVIKTLTRSPRKGNLVWYKPWKCMRFLPDGTLNAVGLTNPGIEWWCKKIGPKMDSSKRAVVGSIYADNTLELIEMAKMLNDYDLVGLEINRSCPNTGGNCLEDAQGVIESCEALEEVSEHPIILKVSVAHPVEMIIPKVADKIEAISINSVPWAMVFPGIDSPLAKYGVGNGGVSGKIAQTFTWGLLKKIVAMDTGVPVIGPSIWDYEDIAAVRKLGAKAVSFGSIFLGMPWRPTLFVRRDMKENNIKIRKVG
jgi:dihydroorotate dehydrogenase (NAD+) catalytic subunit